MRDWESVLAAANRFLLVPSLYEELRKRPDWYRIPADVRDYIVYLHDLNAERNAVLRAQCAEITFALNDIGIVPVLMKGAVALFDHAQGMTASRMMRDIDILVPPEREAESVEVLHALGYGVLNKYPDGHHACGEFFREGDIATVDLHTELIDAPYILPGKGVRARSRPLPYDCPPARRPSMTDRMLHLILHAQIHHLGQFYRGVVLLDQLYELSRLSDRFGDRIDWDVVAATMDAYRLTVPLHSYLLAAEILLGNPWPLPVPPVPAARRHCRRALAQMETPLLNSLLVPAGNVRAAFAWHRMQSLYGNSSLYMQVHHILQFLGKKSARDAVAKIFRYQ